MNIGEIHLKIEPIVYLFGIESINIPSLHHVEPPIYFN